MWEFKMDALLLEFSVNTMTICDSVNTIMTMCESVNIMAMCDSVKTWRIWYSVNTMGERTCAVSWPLAEAQYHFPAIFRGHTIVKSSISV